MTRTHTEMNRVVIGLAMAAVAGLAMLAGSPAQAAEETPRLIESIDATGQVTITRAQIFSAIRLRQGQFFRPDVATEDAARIGKIEGVESAYYKIEPVGDKVKLIYVVVERHLVRELAINGNKKISDSKLAKEIGLKLGDHLDITAARAGQDSIKRLYLEKGYPDVEVLLDEPAMILGRVIYTINEGPRPKIDKVEFSGNTVLSSWELKSGVKTKTKQFLLFSVYYKGEQMFKDAEKIQQEYRKRSYLDAKVEPTVSFNNDKSKARVAFAIQQGPSYRCESISIVGNQFFDSAALRAELKLTAGGMYSDEMAEFDNKKIAGRYLEQGFVDVKVETRRTFLPDSQVRVEFRITEGGRYRIGEISIVGNTVVHDKAIRHVMDEEGFTPGRWYNANTARGDGEGDLEKTIKNTVFTESILIQPVAGKDPNVRDAIVKATEGQTGSIMFGAGVSSDSGVVGNITLDQRNFDISDWPSDWNELITGKAFRGAGQRFRISLSPGFEQSSFLVNFTEPYLYDKPVAMDVAATGFEREWDSDTYETQYTETRLGGRLGFEKRYDDLWRRGVSFRGENVDIDDLEATSPKEFYDAEGGNLLFGIRPYIGKDTTDSRFRPTKGYNFDAGYEQVFGDYTFGVFSGTYRWYHTLYEDLSNLKTVWENRLHGGVIVGDAPFFEKFYAGGNSTIRGFDYRGVSPRADNGDPIGSDWIVNGASEVAVPLGNEIFSWLFFADSAVIETGGPRVSLGTGLQIMIPQWFGPVPMRFELAQPVMKDDDDDTQVFSFSAGALF